MSTIFDEVRKRLAEAHQRAQEYYAARAFEGVMKRAGGPWALVGPVKCIRETSKAILVYLTEGDDEFVSHWIPKSQLHPDENEVEGTGHTGMLVIPEWLAKEKGWL